MKTNKMGAMFLVSVLALAGIGITYAGFTDEISVYGTVNTGTVDIDYVGWYSGTWVYKIWGFEQIPTTPPGSPVVYDLNDEILIYRGFTVDQPTEAQVIAWAQDTPHYGHAELVAYSEATKGTGIELPDGSLSDIDMVYDHIFPCIDFEADFIFHYGGSIPAIIDVAEIFPLSGSYYPETTTNFLEYLWAYHLIAGNEAYGAWVQAFRAEGYDKGNNPTDDWDEIDHWEFGDPVDVGTQLHHCDYIYVKLIIHLPQDNLLQGLSGTFGGKIGVIQWNDQCDDIPGAVG